MSITVCEKKIKNKIKLEDKVAIVENIKYPHFESELHKKLCEKINAFYSSVAEKYSSYSKNKLIRRIKAKKSQIILPVTLSMNYTIALCDEKCISVVIDMTFCEGKKVKMRRFSQMWSTTRKDMILTSDILKTDRKSIRKMYSHVISIAKNNAQNSAFGYFDDYEKKLRRNFDVNCCFVVPNGLCFFINAGILSPLKYGANNFVVPFSELCDVIKGDFLPKQELKTIQNADIVNNV